MMDYIYGHQYFMYWWVGTEAKYLLLDCMVFVGKHIIEDGEKEKWIFQDPQSFCERGAYPDNIYDPDLVSGEIFALDEGDLYQMIDASNLTKVLSLLRYD